MFNKLTTWLWTGALFVIAVLGAMVYRKGRSDERMDGIQDDFRTANNILKVEKTTGDVSEEQHRASGFQRD